MDATLEAWVRKRAKGCCEYCHFPESFAELPFQMDHIVARQHGGTASVKNLALACCSCNRHKGPNLSGVDPETQRITRLFDPRSQIWEEHFAWDGASLAGKTDVGRATIQTLNMNRPDAIAVRELLMEEGVYPA